MGEGWALFFEIGLISGSALVFGFYQLYSLKKAKQRLEAEQAARKVAADRP